MVKEYFGYYRGTDGAINRLPQPERQYLCETEGFNPTGSIKDRIALRMIEEAEQDGASRPARRSSNQRRAIRASAWPSLASSRDIP